MATKYFAFQRRRKWRGDWLPTNPISLGKKAVWLHPAGRIRSPHGHVGELTQFTMYARKVFDAIAKHRTSTIMNTAKQTESSSTLVVIVMHHELSNSSS